MNGRVQIVAQLEFPEIGSESDHKRVRDTRTLFILNVKFLPGRTERARTHALCVHNVRARRHYVATE